MESLLLTSPMEDYLESIARFCRTNGVARVKEIAAELGVRTPTVVGALRTLKEKGLVEQERYGFVRLTPTGERRARQVLSSHETIHEFLRSVLLVDEGQAATEACRIEHAVGADTTMRMRRMATFLASKRATAAFYQERYQARLQSMKDRLRAGYDGDQDGRGLAGPR